MVNLADKVAGLDRLRGELAEATAARRDFGEQVRGFSSRLDATEASKNALEGDLAEARAALREQAEEHRKKLARADQAVAQSQTTNADRWDSCGRHSPQDAPVISTVSPRPELVRTIRIEDNRVAAILDRLDAVDQGAKKNRRGSERQRYRAEQCVVHVQQPGANNSTPYVVATRNISAGGLSFLHGTFVHQGSECVLQLTKTDGAWQNVAGVVTYSRYAEAGLHEVGVRFDGAIGLEDFVCSPGYFRRETVADR